jgi:hypothetical protein
MNSREQRITSRRDEKIEEALEKYSCFHKQDHAGKEGDANKIDLIPANNVSIRDKEGFPS